MSAPASDFVHTAPRSRVEKDDAQGMTSDQNARGHESCQNKVDGGDERAEEGSGGGSREHSGATGPKTLKGPRDEKGSRNDHQDKSWKALRDQGVYVPPASVGEGPRGMTSNPRGSMGGRRGQRGDRGRGRGGVNGAELKGNCGAAGGVPGRGQAERQVFRRGDSNRGSQHDRGEGGGVGRGGKQNRGRGWSRGSGRDCGPLRNQAPETA